MNVKNPPSKHYSLVYLMWKHSNRGKSPSMKSQTYNQHTYTNRFQMINTFKTNVHSIMSSIDIYVKYISFSDVWIYTGRFLINILTDTHSIRKIFLKFKFLGNLHVKEKRYYSRIYPIGLYNFFCISQFITELIWKQTIIRDFIYFSLNEELLLHLMKRIWNTKIAEHIFCQNLLSQIARSCTVL